MVKALIIDDEQTSIEIVEHLLKKYFSNAITLVSRVTSATDGIRDILQFDPELLFLDIEIGNTKTIFNMLKEIDTSRFRIIFTTSHKDYAIEAIRYNAFDYIVKPINQISFKEAVNRFLIERSKTELINKINTINNDLELSKSYHDKVTLPTSNGYKWIKLSNILYCQADVNYCKLVFLDGSTFTVSKTLKHIEQLLPDQVFFRIHKSYLVNKNYVTEYTYNDGGFIFLDNGVKLPVANRKKNIINLLFS